jgi:hypothetical protein
MSFPTKGRRGEAEKAPADFYHRTRQLLLEAAKDRDEAKLRRCSIRIDGARFNDLSDERQLDLLTLYSSAMAACGVLAP